MTPRELCPTVACERIPEHHGNGEYGDVAYDRKLDQANDCLVKYCEHFKAGRTLSPSGHRQDISVARNLMREGRRRLRSRREGRPYRGEVLILCRV